MSSVAEPFSAVRRAIRTMAYSAEYLSCTLNTAYRYGRSGIAIKGKRVRLRTVSIGNKITTTDEWLDRFVAECTAARLGEEAEDQDKPASESVELRRYRQHQQAIDADLAAEGLGAED